MANDQVEMVASFFHMMRGMSKRERRGSSLDPDIVMAIQRIQDNKIRLEREWLAWAERQRDWELLWD